MMGIFDLIDLRPDMYILGIVVPFHHEKGIENVVKRIQKCNSDNTVLVQYSITSIVDSVSIGSVSLIPVNYSITKNHCSRRHRRCRVFFATFMLYYHRHHYHPRHHQIVLLFLS